VTNVALARPGELALGAIDRPSSDPQAVHVLAGGDEYWLEYRPVAPLWLGPGAHRVAVRSIDRAGNRSAAAVRRFRVPR
jgi:hypothetical protein